MTPEDPGLAAVLRQLQCRGATGFRWYKPACLVRRIEVRMRVRGVATLAGYASLLARDAGETGRLLRSLSVRVTGFFRDPDSWQRLREVLAAGPEPRDQLNGWSMGCSTGEEAWSLAMLLLAHARGTGAIPEARVRVVASDVDQAALAVAGTARYPPAAASAIAATLGERFGAVRDSRFEVAPAVRDHVTFRQEDLTGSPAVLTRFDVVSCRNLLIFLGREGQRRVLEAALRGLRPGGLLMLGRTESLTAHPSEALEPIDPVHRIYRRTA